MESESFFVSLFSDGGFESIITRDASGEHDSVDAIFFLCHEELPLQDLDHRHLEFVRNLSLVIFSEKALLVHPERSRGILFVFKGFLHFVSLRSK